jgi:hypothetical protein
VRRYPRWAKKVFIKFLARFFREHGELRNIEICVGGPLIVILRQALKIALADGLL